MTLEDVRLMIKDLKNNKATGLDILLKLLKEYDFFYVQRNAMTSATDVKFLTAFQ